MARVQPDDDWDDLVGTHWGRLLAILARELRELDLAEECLAEALAAAVAAWDRWPDNPPAWLLTTARNRARDALRRRTALERRLPLLVVDPVSPEPEAGVEYIPDERLALVSACCHPGLSAEAGLALSLRLVLGLSTADVARLCLVPEATMAARLTRAKKKISAAGIPLRVPDRTQLPERLRRVCQVSYLLFTSGYAPADTVVRPEVCAEAIRLQRVLVECAPGSAEARSLLALMLLQDARRDARVDPDGSVVLLTDQDRTRWHHDEVAEATALLAHHDGQPGRYAIEAAIAAEHMVGESPDWAAIAALYERLEQVSPSPVVRLNRAVAVAEAAGPEAGLELLDGLEERLPREHLVPSVRADLLRRLGHDDEAVGAYRRALALAQTPAERRLLEQRLAALVTSEGP